jgi:hypothetical protein
MKKYIILAVILTCSLISFSQAKKPKLMVVPSKDWCDKRGFLKTITNQGKTEYISDWETALVKSSELNSVLAKMGAEMQKSGFQLENLQQQIDNLKNERVEEGLRGNLVVDPINEIRARAKADIEMHVYWNVEEQGPRKRISDFRIVGVDTYTNKEVAFAQGSGNWASSGEYTESELLIEAVQSKMDGFKNTLQITFDDMFKNGREVTINFYKTERWTEDFTTDKYGGDELSFVISDWLTANTVQGRYSTPVGQADRMLINGIRIPLYNERNQAMDAIEYARKIKKYLESIGIPRDIIKIDRVGLGKANILIGPQ